MGSGGSELTCARDNLPAEVSTAQRPALVDRAADYDIPRLWCSRDVYGKPQAIARALTAGERELVTRRRDELQAACEPFASFEKDPAADAVAAMLNGFRTLRHMDDELSMMAVQGLLRLLAPFPLWAIDQGCLAIQGGDATLDGEKLSKKYPPNDSEIRSVIAEIVKPYADKRDAAVALLAAPVELRLLEEPRPTGEELKAKYGPNLGMEAAAEAFLEAQAPERRRIAASYTAEDLERLASHLKRDAAA